MKARLFFLAVGVIAASAAMAQPAKTEKATFAGGCFWCMEQPFDELPGVISTTSGYIGGRTLNPTYQQVITGTTGHTEAVEVGLDRKSVV